MYNVSEELKKILNNNRAIISTARLTFSSPQIVITGDNLYSLTIKDTCYNEGRIIGTNIATDVEVEIKDSGYNLQDKEFYLEVGIQLSNGTYEYIPYGYFVIDNIENVKSSNKIKVKAMDRMIKLNEDFKEFSASEYPMKLKQFLVKFANQYGIELANQTLPNENFIIKTIPYLTGMTGRQVVKQLAEMFGKFAKINREGKLGFYLKNQTNEKITRDKMNSNLEINDLYGEVNVVTLSLSTDIDGENVTRRDEESIAKYGENIIEISGNAFANTEEERSRAIDEIFNSLKGFKYIPTSFTYMGKPYLDCGDTIEVQNMKDDNYNESIVLNNYIVVPRLRTSKMENKALTNTEVKLQYTDKVKSLEKHTELVVDKVNQTIKSVIKKQEEQSQTITEVKNTADGTQSQLNTFLNTTYVNDIDNIQKQIDGAIQFWNGENIPTLNNYPASEWKTEQERINHQADIYTVIQDVQGELKQGKSYRFDKVNNTWQWIELTDNELSAVQALANSKAKVYVVQPTPPYNIGDLWLKDNELYECSTAKDSSGTFSASDWKKATKYTDDTVANEALNKANTNTTEIAKTNTALSEITQTTESIKSRVETTENTVETINGELKLKDNVNGYPIHIENAGAYKAIDYTVAGNSEQSNTPTRDESVGIKTVGIKSFIKDIDIHTQNNSLYYLGKNYLYSNNELSECIELEANTTYTFSCSEYTSDNKLTLMDSSKTALTRVTLKGVYTFTTTQKCWLHYYSNLNTEKPIWQLINCGTQIDDLSYGNWLINKITGKNLLKLDDKLIAGYTTTVQGITYTFNQNGSITISGTTGANISSIVLLGDNLNNYATKRWHEDEDIVVNFSVAGLALNCRLTSGTYSSLVNAKGKDVGVIYLQVNPNTTIDTTIYPFVTYEASNSFEIYKENIVKLNLNKESLIDGNFKQGNNTSDKNDMKRLFTTQNYKLKSNQTYIFSTDMDITKYKYAIITNTAEFPTSTSTNVYNSGWLTTSRHTFASTSNAYFGILIGKIDGSNLTPDDIKDYKFILYEGTDAFPYHELKKIDDVSDEVNMTTGILTKRIGKVLLDGSESGWAIHNTTSVRNAYKISIQDLYSYTNGYAQPLIMCSHFKPISQQDTWLPGTCTLRVSTTEIVFNVEPTQTLEQFKTWLSSNPVTVYYVLETPETIQLEAQKIELFEGENNVKIISDLNPSTTHLNYYTKSGLNNVYQEQFAQQEITNNSIEQRVSASEENTASLEKKYTSLSETVEGFDFNVVKDIQEKIENGDIKSNIVETTTVRIDADGLHTKKSGSQMQSLLDNEGVYVNNGDIDKTATKNNTLTVDKDGVVTENLYVRTYATLGYHRTEGFSENGELRTGVFYQGGEV